MVVVTCNSLSVRRTETCVRKHSIELSSRRTSTTTIRLTFSLAHTKHKYKHYHSITYTHIAYTTHPYKYFIHISTSYTTYSTCRPHRENDTEDRQSITVTSASLFTGVHGRPPLPLRPESMGTGQRRPADR